MSRANIRPSRETLAGALAAAHGLPADLSDAVLHTARLAFTDGLHLAALTAAVAMLVGAVTALVTLRGVPPTEPARQEGHPVNASGRAEGPS
jgi:MFS transporter, DHA2 family, multidrug resistance protein